MILILKHISIEGPGTIESYLKERDVDYKILELQEGDVIPDSLDGISAIISLGGPMNVYEEEKYPYLAQEDVFLKKALEANLPMLGVCLGSQLIAKAANAKVTQAKDGEVGWFKVALTPQGLVDPLLKGVGAEFTVFQWHQDTFEIPSLARHLSSSPLCSNQAYGLNSAYGLQFHIEVDRDIIASWICKYYNVEDASKHPKGLKMLDEYDQHKEAYNKQSEIIYENFMNIVESRKVNV